MHRKRRQPKRYRKPDLTIEQILAWADDYKRRIGRWPNHKSGRIRPYDENWSAINAALAQGNRGMPGGSSLANLLLLHRGVRNRRNLPPLDEQEIVRLVRGHLKRTGALPNKQSGAIPEAPGETWLAIDFALLRGKRGLAGRSSLAQLLAARGFKMNPKCLPPLAANQILAWADAFFRRHDEWPSRVSGPVTESPIETWSAIDTALRTGLRGLRGGQSLAAFLNEHRNLYRGKARRPKRIRESKRLRVEDILAWGRAHWQRTGKWPNRDSGAIPDVPGRTWLAVDSALKAGCNGLPGGSSLAKLFHARREH